MAQWDVISGTAGTTKEKYNAGYEIRHKPAETLFVVTFPAGTATREFYFNPPLPGMIGSELLGLSIDAALPAGTQQVLVTSNELTTGLIGWSVVNGAWSNAIACVGLNIARNETILHHRQPKLYTQARHLDHLDLSLKTVTGALVNTAGVNVTATLVIFSVPLH